LLDAQPYRNRVILLYHMYISQTGCFILYLLTRILGGVYYLLYLIEDLQGIYNLITQMMQFLHYQHIQAA